MAVEQIERSFPQLNAEALFGEVQKVLRPYIERFSLAQEEDPQSQRIRVWRTGFEGKLQVEGSLVRLALDYSWLIPGALRDRITRGVVDALAHLGQQPTAGGDPSATV